MERPSPVTESAGVICVVLAIAVGFALLLGCSDVAKREQLSPEREAPAESAPAEMANYTETIPGTEVKFEMIAIPGGTFVMGSPESEEGREPDEGPQHRVTVAPFWIGKTEVTWDAYDAFREACPPPPDKTYIPAKDYVDGATGPTPPYGDPYRGFGGGPMPVVGVSWYAAIFYCQWLSAVTGKTYRLPTEAEWEYACRAGSGGAFSFGDDSSKLDEYAWYSGNSDYETNRVATKKPNDWGIYGMLGNVSEWCLDWYAPRYYASFPADGWPKNPKGPDQGKNHVMRGGSWNSDASGARPAARACSDNGWLAWDPQEPKSHWWLVPTNFLGFRVVRTLEKDVPKVPLSTNGL